MIVERLLVAVVLVIFGGAIAGGLLAPLTLIDVGIGLLIVVVRPVTGLLGLVGTGLAWRTRAVIATFGIRGTDSFYYLAYALNHSSLQERELLVAADSLWAFLGFVVLLSVLIHGIIASPVMDAFERWEAETDSLEA